jgi:hypothetical protein
MSIQLFLLVAVGAPGLIALLMPGPRTLAAYTLIAGVLVSAELGRFEASLNDDNDGPATVFAAMTYHGGLASLLCGSVVRLFVLAYLWPRRRRRVTQ